MKKQFHKIKIAAENFSQRFVLVFFFAIHWMFEGQTSQIVPVFEAIAKIPPQETSNVLAVGVVMSTTSFFLLSAES